MIKKKIKAILASKYTSELDKLKLILITVILKGGLPIKNSIKMAIKIIEGKKILWVEIKSSIYTFLAAEATFTKINSYASKAGADIDKIVVTPADVSDDKSKKPVCFSWIVNNNDRRNKTIHSRHYADFCHYLWWDFYIPNFLKNLSDNKKDVLHRVFYDQVLQDKYIMISLTNLFQEGYFVDNSDTAESVYTKITDEWQKRNKRKALGKTILFRFKAIEIGSELGLFKTGEKRNQRIFSGGVTNPVESYVEIMELLEHMVKGSIISISRKKEIVMIRHILMYIIRKTTPDSLQKIGLDLGNRDHTTIIHAIRKIEEKMKTSPVLENVIEQLCILFDNIRIYKSAINFKI